jgi:hypothetical protein
MVVPGSGGGVSPALGCEFSTWSTFRSYDVVILTVVVVDIVIFIYDADLAANVNPKYGASTSSELPFKCGRIHSKISK